MKREGLREREGGHVYERPHLSFEFVSFKQLLGVPKNLQDGNWNLQVEETTHHPRTTERNEAKDGIQKGRSFALFTCNDFRVSIGKTLGVSSLVGMPGFENA